MIETAKAEGIQLGETRGIQIGETRGIQIGETRGIQIGETRGEARLVQTMIKNGTSLEEAAKITGLSITRIKELLKIQFGVLT